MLPEPFGDFVTVETRPSNWVGHVICSWPIATDPPTDPLLTNFLKILLKARLEVFFPVTKGEQRYIWRFLWLVIVISHIYRVKLGHCH